MALASFLFAMFAITRVAGTRLKISRLEALTSDMCSDIIPGSSPRNSDKEKCKCKQGTLIVGDAGECVALHGQRYFPQDTSLKGKCFCEKALTCENIIPGSLSRESDKDNCKCKKGSIIIGHSNACAALLGQRYFPRDALLKGRCQCGKEGQTPQQLGDPEPDNMPQQQGATEPVNQEPSAPQGASAPISQGPTAPQGASAPIAQEPVAPQVDLESQTATNGATSPSIQHTSEANETATDSNHTSTLLSPFNVTLCVSLAVIVALLAICFCSRRGVKAREEVDAVSATPAITDAARSGEYDKNGIKHVWHDEKVLDRGLTQGFRGTVVGDHSVPMSGVGAGDFGFPPASSAGVPGSAYVSNS